jgi:hypothetical protein
MLGIWTCAAIGSNLAGKLAKLVGGFRAIHNFPNPKRFHIFKFQIGSQANLHKQVKNG